VPQRQKLHPRRGTTLPPAKPADGRRVREGNSTNGSIAMLKLRNLEKWFDTKAGRTWVLRNINLDVREGEFVTIMGPSGAGKSTMLGILGMLDANWAGEYYFFDQPVHLMKPKQRAELNKRYIGFVFQQYHLLDDLTVAENLDVPLSYRDVPRDERQAIVADTLDRFQIVGKKDLYPRQLSGGQQQLVGVARAVIAKPALLLADEPTGNLHSSQARDIMDLFVGLNQQGTTIVQVTHSEENAMYGSRTISMRDGWVVDDRPTR
jgi:putative ABC transport system ATP-binding protein